MRCLIGNIDSIDRRVSELREIVKDREACYAASLRLQSQTWLINWTPKCTLQSFFYYISSFQYYLFSHVQSCACLWTLASQTPLSMGFSRQNYWNGLPFPSLHFNRWCATNRKFWDIFIYNFFISPPLCHLFICLLVLLKHKWLYGLHLNLLVCP